MTDDETMLIEAKEARLKQRRDRRDFFRTFGVAAAAAGGAAYALKGSNALAQEASITDLDILNFALNLEYLEANYYHLGVFGEPIPSDLMSGTGTQGKVMGGAKVDFSNAPPVLEPIFREIAADELAHVEFLRTALGDNAVAQPTLDLRQSADGAFSTLARAAGILEDGENELPVYGDFKDFVLGAFVFEDVGVTAYKGAAPLITDKESYLGAAAGILAVESYHASIIRTTLYNGPDPYPEYADKISDARDSVDGDTDLDQPITATNNANGDPVSNIVPLDDNGLAFSRSAAQVLNVVYLNNKAVTSGGFFPDGVNGTINMSGAN